jgi:hypothetical protein
MKKILLVSILLIPLMLIGNQIAYAGGESPLPGESVIGPTMDGIVWLTPLAILDCQVCLAGVFLGNCNGKPFVIDRDIPGSIDTVTPGNFIDFRILNAGPPGCRSPGGGEELIITAVKNFDKNSERVLADVDLKFVISK